MDIPVVITIEAGLSFLGLGVRPPTPSWGNILNDGYAFIRNTPWLVISGGLPLVLATLGFTFLGEALRDVFDPRLQRGLSRRGRSLDVRDLSVDYATPRGAVHALRHVDLAVPRGEIVGIVGESGCGKTTLISAVMQAAGRQCRDPSRRRSCSTAATSCTWRRRAPAPARRRIAMVFQDPMTALNPVLTIGEQIVDIQYRRRDEPGREAAAARRHAAAGRHLRRRAARRPLSRTSSRAACASASASPWRCSRIPAC